LGLPDASALGGTAVPLPYNLSVVLFRCWKRRCSHSVVLGMIRIVVRVVYMLHMDIGLTPDQPDRGLCDIVGCIKFC